MDNQNIQPTEPTTNEQPDAPVVPIRPDFHTHFAGSHDGDYLQQSIARNINNQLQDSTKFGEPPAGHKRFFLFPRKRVNNIQVSPQEVPVDIVKTDEDGNVRSQIDKETKKILVPLNEDAEERWSGYEEIEEDVLSRYVDKNGTVVSDKIAQADAKKGGHNYRKAVFFGVIATAAAGVAIGVALINKDKPSKR